MNDKGRKNAYIKHEFEDGEIKDVRETNKIFNHRKRSLSKSSSSSNDYDISKYESKSHKQKNRKQINRKSRSRSRSRHRKRKKDIKRLSRSRSRSNSRRSSNSDRKNDYKKKRNEKKEEQKKKSIKIPDLSILKKFDEKNTDENEFGEFSLEDNHGKNNLLKRREERHKRIEELKNKVNQTDNKVYEQNQINTLNLSRENQVKLLNFIEKEREQNFQEEFRKSSNTREIVDFSLSPATPDMFAKTPEDQLVENQKKIINQPSMLEDSTGYYTPQMDEILNEKYKVIGFCGKGIFSNVIKVVDINNNNKEYAVKIIRSIDVMLISGEKERSILKKLNEVDKNDKSNILRLIDTFEMKRHICMVFELYEMNLRELLKSRAGYGLPLATVRLIAQQLLYAFDLIHKFKIIHADFKPDNTIINKTLDRIRLCDFGSALQEDEVVITSELVSRFYRAPEIILGYPYDTKIDIWSLGCSLYELYTGKILFSGRNNNEMLKLIMQTRGKIPSKLIKRGQYSNSYFNERGDFLSLELDSYTKEEYVKELNVNNYPSKDLGYILKNEAGKEDPKILINFKDFLEKCLHLDPSKRLTALDLLTHEFIGILPVGVFSK